MQNLPRTTLEEILRLHAEKKLVGAFNLSSRDYHASPGISKSALDDVAESPKHYRARLLKPKKWTEALIFGGYYHAALLDPEELRGFYVTDTQPKEPKQDERNRWPIAKRHVQTISEMVEVFTSDPIAMKALDGFREISFFWTDPTTGVLCKCKPDVVMREGIVADLKTTADCSDVELSKAIANYGYDVQGVMALDGVRLALEQAEQDIGILTPEKFMLVAQEKTDIYDINYRPLCPNSIVKGEELYRERLEKYAICATTNVWPGKSGGVIREISSAGWHLKEKL